MKHIPKLRSHAGFGMTTFVILSLPLLLLLLALVVNGMAAVATYRRAVALATLGVQAGASSVDFGGASQSIVHDDLCNERGYCGMFGAFERAQTPSRKQISTRAVDGT